MDKDFGFPPSRRIRKRPEFNRLFAEGRKLVGRRLIAFVSAANVDSRLGVVVSKRWGGAVKRNRIKRLLREAFRLSRNEFPFPIELLLLPRAFGPEVGLQEVVDDLVRLVKRYTEFAEGRHEVP